MAEQLYTFEFSSRKNMMGVRTKRFAVIRNHGERAHQEGEVTEAAHLTTTKSEDGRPGKNGGERVLALPSPSIAGARSYGFTYRAANVSRL